MQARVVSIHLMGGKHSKKQPKHIRLIERGLCGDDYWCCPDAVLHGNNMVANKEDDPKMSCRAKSVFVVSSSPMG